MFYRDFPYTNFHEINLDWILAKLREYINLTDILENNIKEFEDRVTLDIENFKTDVNNEIDDFKLYVTNYLEDLAVPEEVQRILDQWLEDGVFDEVLNRLVDEYMAEMVEAQERKLTSNDIDVENLFSYINADGRYKTATQPGYVVFQSIAVDDNGQLYTVANDETDALNRGLIRKIDPNTGNILQQGYADVGHANGMTYANGYLYVVWMTDSEQGVNTGKISKINTNTLALEQIIDTNLNIRGIAYNTDKDQFIVCGSNNFYVLSADFSEQIDYFQLPINTYHPNQALQDIFYYNNYVGVVCAYPNLIAFYDLTSKELVKYYNPKQRINDTGVPFNEPESAFYYDKKFYLCGFARLDNEYSYSNIAIMDPWHNVKTDYFSRNRYSGIKNIYVDGNARNNPIQTGDEDAPFGHIMLAVAGITSEIGLYNAITISCAKNTRVGSLVCHDIANLALVAYGEGTGKYTLTGLRLNRCSNFLIDNANIQYDKSEVTGSANAYIINSTGQITSTIIDDSVTSDREPNMGLYVASRSNVVIVDFTAGSNFDVGIQINQQSEVTLLGTTNNTAPTRVRTINQSVLNSTIKMKPADARYNFESMTKAIKPWVNVFKNTSGFTSLNTTGYLDNDSYISDINQGITEIAFESGLGGETKRHVIPLVTDNGTASFQLNNHHAFGTNVWESIIYGTINLTNKTFIITEQISLNHGAGTQFIRSQYTGSGIAWGGIFNIWVR